MPRNPWKHAGIHDEAQIQMDDAEGRAKARERRAKKKDDPKETRNERIAAEQTREGRDQ